MEPPIEIPNVPSLEAPPTPGRRGFVPLQPVGSNIWPILTLVLVLLIGILVAVIVDRRRRWMEKMRQTRQRWERVHEICAERTLTTEEEKALTDSLQEISESSPERSLLSPGYFTATVAPELKRRLGDKRFESVRRKLFFGGPLKDQKETLGGTHELTTGQKLRMHFAGVSGTFPCTVLNVSDANFVISLPLRGNRHIQPRHDDVIEGYMELGDALYSFESTVESTFSGGIFACRIHHTQDIKQVHQRDSTRVKVDKKIIFSYLPGSRVSSGQVDLANLEQKLVNKWDGMIRDISVGGCAIVTPTRHRFEAGDFVQFGLDLLPDEPAPDVLGTIIHITPIPIREGGGQALHLEFLGLDDEALGTLTRAVHRLKGD